MKLERIVPGSRLSGIAGDGAVEVVATRSYGPDAVEVAWRGPDGLGDRILYREDEPRIREVSPGRRWAFDGDGDAFRLGPQDRQTDIRFRAMSPYRGRTRTSTFSWGLSDIPGSHDVAYARRCNLTLPTSAGSVPT